MADEHSPGPVAPEEGTAQPERTSPPEYLFRLAWEEINERMSRLRHDLELAERGSLGEDVRQELAKKLAALQGTVDSFAERWMDFERRRKALEESLSKEP